MSVLVDFLETFSRNRVCYCVQLETVEAYSGRFEPPGERYTRFFKKYSSCGGRTGSYPELAGSFPDPMTT